MMVKWGLIDNFGQGFPWFRPWLPLGLVYFLGLGEVSRSGGIWKEVGGLLVRIGGERWVF